MEAINRKRSMGWLHDYPDFRDFTAEDDEISRKMKVLGQKDTVRKMLSKAGVTKAGTDAKRSRADLRQWFPAVEDQGDLGSCTANAGVGLLEYFECRAFGQHTDASRLFLYKATRNMMHWRGDTGAFLRNTMGAMVLFGVPPEEYWPYVTADFDKEPSAFCYAFAQNYQAISYYRLDPPETTKEELLARIKAHLGAGLPSMFGFTVYSSYEQADTTGMIPFPVKGDTVIGGHAVVAAGYDDSLMIKNTDPKAKETKGALLIRNSWGTGWGEGGYGWLPYEYVRKGLATDWWSLIKSGWIDTGAFGQVQ